MIPIYKPYLTNENLKYSHDAINSGWISSQGQYLDIVKDRLKKEFNFERVILTNNGTTATHLMAIAIKYKYPHINKIIVPNNVYVAAWNSFLFDKNFKLIPIDSNLNTWNFEESKLDSLIDETTAVLIVHNIGNIINVPKLKLKFPKTIFIEDNCEGFTGKYDGLYTGTQSFASSISFFGNKTITSGEGGAFITNDEDVFEYINKVKSQGQSQEKFIHDVLGYNYRMTNVQAAILYGQLLDLEKIKKMKNYIFDEYFNNLKNLDGVSFQFAEKNTVHSEWMFGIRLHNLSMSEKKQLELDLFKSQIETRPMFYTIKKHKHLTDLICDTENSEILESQCLILPSFPELTKNQINFICDKLKYFLYDKYENRNYRTT